MESSLWRVILLELLATSVLLSGVCEALECWQCIADDCHLDPAGNYRAAKRVCQPGQSCQKVEYEGRDSDTKTDYVSTVRSCSQGDCVNHADNCSDQLLTNPGCMIRHCCNGKNLCNAAPSGERGYVAVTMVFCSMAFLLSLTFASSISSWHL